MSKPKSFDLKIKFWSLVVDQETTVALTPVNMHSGKSHHDSTRTPFRPEETICTVVPCGILDHLTRLDAELVNPKNAFQAKLWKRLGNRLNFHIKELRHYVYRKKGARVAETTNLLKEFYEADRGENWFCTAKL